MRKPVILTVDDDLDVLHAIERGEAMKQTARILGISVRTVENTRARLFKKLNCRNSTHALSRAHELGLTEASC